jgi:hypothetical protein
VVVDRGVVREVLDTEAEADLGGQMTDHIHTDKRGVNHLGVSDVADHRIARYGVRPPPVQHPHLVPAPSESEHRVRADESGATGDQDLLGHDLPTCRAVGNPVASRALM